MASNRFRYPPAPGHGGDTFSDNLVGNQFVDGSSQMTMGNFSISSDVSRPNTVSTQQLGSFTAPITLEDLDIGNLALAKTLSSNNLEVFINNDTSDITSFVLYGSLNKRLNIAVENIINNFPAALYVDGYTLTSASFGNITAYNIVYNSATKETEFRVNVNSISNPFAIEFTTNGELLNSHISPEEILNNANQYGYSADTILGIAEGKINKLRNLTTEYPKYSLTFSGGVQYEEYQVVDFTSQTPTSGFITLKVKGEPFGTTATTSYDKFYIKPNNQETEKVFKEFNPTWTIERFLLNRESNPIYTATFKVVKETTEGVSYFDNVKKTWPLQDEINLDIETIHYSNYLNTLAELANEIDKEKTNLISRFLTSPSLKEFDTSSQKVEKTLQVYGRSFDDIKTYVDGIAYMTNVTYDSKNNIPNNLIKNFARTLGWNTPSTLDKDKFLDGVLGTTKPLYSGTTISKTPAELDIELYRRILMNTSYLFKSKGSRKSIEFLLSLLGAPDALVEFNEYVVVADAKLNVNKFDYYWSQISGGSYVRGEIETSILLPPNNPFFIATATTTHPFIRADYPIDNDGYPTTPRITNNYFFQRGAGWVQRTEEHKSNIIIDNQQSTLTGCTPNIVTKFKEFTWGGFWTQGKFSNDVQAPYLDRFWRFPHLYYGFRLRRIIDDKKSWVREFDKTPLINLPFKNFGHLPEPVHGVDFIPPTQQQIDNFANIYEPKEYDSVQTRDYDFGSRAAYYQTTDERLVLNVKNVDLSLNIGQGLAYDIWQQSVQSDCFFSGGSLPSPYPNAGGRWDATNPKINAKELDFKTFLKDFWRYFIDTKNRMTINDGKTGGYPTLQKIYMDYLNKTCGENNQYTYNKMISYIEDMGDYWPKLVEQMLPTTTLWTGGMKVTNSIFHRDKFVYRCFSLSGTVSQSATTTQINTAISGWTSFPAPQFRMLSTTIPYPPTIPSEGAYYNNILTGATINPLSSYATGYNIKNRDSYFGTNILDEKTKELANKFHTNEDEYSLQEVFTKQGSTNNLLCIHALKPLGPRNTRWLDDYNITGSGPNAPITTMGSSQPTGGSSPSYGTSSPSSGGGGGASSGGGGGMSSGGGGGGGY